MARKRQGTIYESAEQLNELASRHNGQQESRLRMLLLLHQDSSRTVIQAADMINCSEKTVRRWWKIYQEGGIDALLAGREEKSTTSTAQSTPYDRQSDLVPPHLVQFLNALPITSYTVEWVEEFRSALGSLLGDVDRITVTVNVHSQPDGDPGDRPGSYVAEHVGPRTEGLRSLSTLTFSRSRMPGMKLVDSMKAQGFPTTLYHPPHIFDYHTSQGIYIGSIILWRDRAKRSISERSTRTMAQLEPFIIFSLSDCAARRRQTEPDLRIFTDIITSVGEREGLTTRQREVMLHQLLGKQYHEIAAALGITEAAIRKHVTSIHQKTATRNFNELFARYFAPAEQKYEGKKSGQPERGQLR